MSRKERCGYRDLTYSMWHRNIEDYDQCTLPYVDIDAVEYCQKCKEPLALIETAQDVGQEFKATTVMRKLAAKAGLPAYLVLYRKSPIGVIDRFRVKLLYPRYTLWHIMYPEKYIAFLKMLREKHTCAGEK